MAESGKTRLNTAFIAWKSASMSVMKTVALATSAMPPAASITDWMLRKASLGLLGDVVREGA